MADERKEAPDPELSERLRALDHPVPRVSADQVIMRARVRRTPWLRRAAVLVVALGAAGAAWALPGSPLRGWVRDLTGTNAAEPPAITASPTTPPSPPDAGGGIALDATLPQVIVFESAADASLDVIIVNDGPIAVRHVGGGARFTADADRTRVDAIEPGTRFVVEIPRGAARVELRVGRRVPWAWPGGAATRIDLAP